MSDRGLNNVMAQYFNDVVPTTTFAGSQVLAGAKPTLVSAGDVEAMVRALLDDGTIASNDFPNTVFNFLLPKDTVLNDDEAPTQTTSRLAREGARSGVPDDDEGDSLHGLGGYHGSVHVDAATTVYYAVGVYSRVHNGQENGIPVFKTPWKNVVATFYHELNEARTDPDVDDVINGGSVHLLGWTSRQGEECGDFPVFEANPLSEVFVEVPLANGHGTVPVQLMYSNAAHGPEGPIPQPH
jgi:hypothetical protein